MRQRYLVVAVGALALAPAAVGGTYFEDFESYAPGTVLHDVGGWYGWDNVPAAAGIVSNALAHTGLNSIDVSGGTDAVHPFSGITSGQWTLTAWQYIPSNFTTDTYFIVNNEYYHGGPYTWAIELRFDFFTGTVLDDFRPENLVPIAFDQWVEIRIDIDLDADTQTTFYNGALLSTGTYTVTPGSPLEIANIDLFTYGTQVYYDDISLVPAPGILALLGVAGLAGAPRRRVRI